MDLHDIYKGEAAPSRAHSYDNLPKTTRFRGLGVLALAEQKQILDQVILRLHRAQVRPVIVKEIENLDLSIKEVLEHAQIFLATTQMVKCHNTVLIVDEAQLTKSICRFIESSNAIIGHLDCLEEDTGIPSGGDPALKSRVEFGRFLMLTLMHSLVCHTVATQRPGMEFGLRYRHDTRVVEGSVMLRNGVSNRMITSNQDAALPDHQFRTLHPDYISRNWHFTGVLHPVVHVPGTQWHKYLGNLAVRFPNQALLFRGEAQPRIEVYFPTVGANLMGELGNTYLEYRQHFEEAGNRYPGGLKTDEQRMIDLLSLMNSMSLHEDCSVLAKGERSAVSPHEGLFNVHRPEQDPFGRVRFEYFNLHLNRRDLAGLALPGENFSMGVPVEHTLFWEVYAEPNEFEDGEHDWDDDDDEDEGGFGENEGGNEYLDWDALPLGDEEGIIDAEEEREGPVVMSTTGEVLWD